MDSRPPAHRDRPADAPLASPPHTTHDVLVVGCGIVGASCAWHLARAGLRVLVVERESGPAMGSTGRSAAGVRVLSLIHISEPTRPY